MSFALGAGSRRELKGVHPILVALVERAIVLTEQDFAVHDGLRTTMEQARLLDRGATKTMNSRHLKQKDGFGHAVDLVPYVNGKLRWEWPLIYPIASAMVQAAHEQEVSVRVRWGAAWDRSLGQLHVDPDDIRGDVERYCQRHPGRDFLDGPHYELVS